jgi:pimeloyl-ACP methyl ester carboxylesterase
MFESLLDFIIRNQSLLLPPIATFILAAMTFVVGRALPPPPAAPPVRVHFMIIPDPELVLYGLRKFLYFASRSIVVLCVGYVLISIVLSLISKHLDAKYISDSAGLPLPQPQCKPDRASAKTAIVFIHGWSGDSAETWKMFPELVCNDPSLTDVQVYVVNYPTILDGRGMRVDGMAFWLRQDFLTDKIYPKFDAVHIIAHSLGGVIARRIFLYDPISGSVSKIKSLISIASPFQGATVARLANALGVSHDFVDDLTPQSGFLQQLANEWSFAQGKPYTACFTSPQDAIVTQDSARSQCGCPFVYPQWGHVEMVKPLTVDDDRYRAPIRAMKSVMGRAEKLCP